MTEVVFHHPVNDYYDKSETFLAYPTTTAVRFATGTSLYFVYSRPCNFLPVPYELPVVAELVQCYVTTGS